MAFLFLCQYGLIIQFTRKYPDDFKRFYSRSLYLPDKVARGSKNASG